VNPVPVDYCHEMKLKTEATPACEKQGRPSWAMAVSGLRFSAETARAAFKTRLPMREFVRPTFPSRRPHFAMLSFCRFQSKRSANQHAFKRQIQ